MKKRFGFVSNSSSSSFCIYGTIIPDGNYDEFELRIKGTNLELHSPPESDTLYIGLSPTDIEMDETRKQFQERVAKLLKDCNIENTSLGWHSEGWYDG